MSVTDTKAYMDTWHTKKVLSVSGWWCIRSSYVIVFLDQDPSAISILYGRSGICVLVCFLLRLHESYSWYSVYYFFISHQFFFAHHTKTCILIWDDSIRCLCSFIIIYTNCDLVDFSVNILCNSLLNFCCDLSVILFLTRHF